jgi:hypothetical protein
VLKVPTKQEGLPVPGRNWSWRLVETIKEIENDPYNLGKEKFAFYLFYLCLSVKI